MAFTGMPSEEQLPQRMFPPRLNTIPSELRKLIVSFLAPSGSEQEIYARHAKKHLKNANLAHRCLHEWVTEYMFRDMSLVHISAENASHLERFAIDPSNSGLLKHVRTIKATVPPAIRWDVGSEVFDTMQDLTRQRLLRKFHVTVFSELSDSQQRWCLNYYRAMVQPFSENGRWYQLLDTAEAAWGEIFGYFGNLEYISIGTCKRIHHPAPSYTNAFITQYGENVDEGFQGQFREDPTVNNAWASSIILASVPGTVKSLRLSMANIDNLSSFSTVNRLLVRGFHKKSYLQNGGLNAITKLTLDLQGQKGTHGTRVWLGNTGSAGLVKSWRKVLSSMYFLTHLDLNFDVQAAVDAFTFGEESDLKGCILDWLFSDLVLSRVKNLRFRSFLIDSNSICTPKIFATQAQWPALRNIVFEDTRLMLNTDPYLEASQQNNFSHLQGESWVQACQCISETIPGIQIKLIYPVSNINDSKNYELHPECSDRIRQLMNITVDGRGSEGVHRNQEAHICGTGRNYD